MYMVNVFSAAYDLFIIHCRLLIIFLHFAPGPFLYTCCFGDSQQLKQHSFFYGLFGSPSAQDLW